MISIQKIIASFGIVLALLMERTTPQNYAQAINSYMSPVQESLNQSSGLTQKGSFVAQTTAQDWIRQAFDKSQRGDFSGAISDLNHAIELDPKNTTTYDNRAAFRLMLNDYTGAVADATRSIELDPNKTLPYLNRASARFYQKHYRQAIEDYNQAIKLGVPPDNLFGVYYSRGESRRLAGDLAGAIADCTKAIQLNPQSGEAYDNRGLAYVDKGEANYAIDDFHKAAELFQQGGDWKNYQAVLKRLESLRARGYNAKELSVQEINQWMTYYYLHPKPALVPQAIAIFSKQGIFSNPASIPAFVAFFSFIFRDNSEQLTAWFSQILKLPASEQKIFIRALWYANTPQSHDQLITLRSQVSSEQAKYIDSILKQKTIPIEKLDLSPAILDMLWAGFMVTGDSKYVVRIIFALPLINDQKNFNNFSTGRTAIWSLASNAMQHKKVMEICRAEVDSQPVEVASILKEVIQYVNK